MKLLSLETVEEMKCLATMNKGTAVLAVKAVYCWKLMSYSQMKWPRKTTDTGRRLPIWDLHASRRGPGAALMHSSRMPVYGRLESRTHHALQDALEWCSIQTSPSLDLTIDLVTRGDIMFARSLN